MDIIDRLDMFLVETAEVNEAMTAREKATADWNKIIKVIQSIDNPAQLQTAREMIKNFIKVHGKEHNHGMLELELKSKSRRLKQ